MEVPKNAFKYTCTMMQDLLIVCQNRYLELASTNRKIIGLLGKKKSFLELPDGNMGKYPDNTKRLSSS